MSRTLPALLFLALLLSGCAGQLDDARFPTGSSTLIASADYQRLHVVDTDGGSLSSLDLNGGLLQSLELGVEPTRIARAGERLFVTLRGERAVAVIDDRGGELVLAGRLEVGAEPFGVIAGESGERLWVVSSLSGRVDEFNTESLETLRSWPIDNEPRWLALHPSERSLYVASVRDALFTRIDLDSGLTETIELPMVTGVGFESFDLLDLSARITGDPGVSSDGRSLAVPVLYVDNISPVPPPLEPDHEPIEGENMIEVGGGYGGPGGATRFHAGVVTFSVAPDGSLEPGSGVATEVTGTGSDFGLLRSYPSSAVFAPDGETIVLPLEGSSAVLSVRARGQVSSFPNSGVDDIALPEAMPGTASMAFNTVRTSLIGAAGPRSVAFTADDRAFVDSFLERAITDMDFVGFEAPEARPLPGPLSLLNRVETPLGMVEEPPMVIEQLASYAEEPLSADVVRGRRLFYAADNPSMAAHGAGVSCATCHFDGRTDGLTWRFSDGRLEERQTPSLAGQVSVTVPLTWVDAVESLVDEVLITSQGRMGGQGLPYAAAEDVAAYIDWSREADVPLAGSSSAAVARGREIFHRAEVGCADCHNGTAWTDNLSYDLYGVEAIRTPSLVGVAATAPYLHNGSADSIKTLLRWSQNLAMGDTSSLDEAELADLEQFVLSL